jgi:hypothetical protein
MATQSHQIPHFVFHRASPVVILINLDDYADFEGVPSSDRSAV